MVSTILAAEIAFLSVFICGLHALKPRFGLIPLYAVMGLLEAFLFVAGKPQPQLMVELFFGAEGLCLDTICQGHLAYLLFLPAMLVCTMVVYVLEGTREARRLLLAVAVLYFLHGCFDVMLEFHSENPPPGREASAGNDVYWYVTRTRIASFLSIMADFLVIIISYQFLQNRLKKLPLFIPLFGAILCAMIADGSVFGLANNLTFDPRKLRIFEKLQAGLVAGIPVAIYLQYQLGRTKEEVVGGRVERGAFAIIDLRRKVSQMEQKLEEQRAQYLYIKDTFSRYVSPDVVDAIIADPSKVQLGGEVREVTILFADIRGYSTLSEALEPTEIIGLLNRYFHRVSDVILGTGGMINEFEGDAVLAVFGAPLPMDDHADRALRAAHGMLDEVKKLNIEWDQDGTSEAWRGVGIDELAIRIGIHSGSVVAGNIGSQARIKYAVIGDTVNTASRVEGLNKVLETSLLVTHATRQMVTSEDVVFRDLGQHQVKGRTEPVHVFTTE
jgi:class 3 adenylate cyclase